MAVTIPTEMPTTIDRIVAAPTSLSVIGTRNVRSSHTGSCGAGGYAKVTLEDVTEPQEVAGDDGCVEVEVFANDGLDGRTLFRVLDLDQERQRIAGVGHHHVDDERRRKHDKERGNQASEDESSHVVATTSLTVRDGGCGRRPARGPGADQGSTGCTPYVTRRLR